jgi:hypothetical protein
MAGQGKYTTYVPQTSDRNTRLGRLFKGNSRAENPFAVTLETGDQEKAREQTVERAEQFLRTDRAEGDKGHFPRGVDMTYKGDEADTTVPNLPDVKWESAGDPANPYMPDPTSPGPGSTDPSSKDTDPELAPVDIKGEGYVPGQPGVSTARNPSDTNDPIREANKLGTTLPLGKNSDNEPSGF